MCKGGTENGRKAERLFCSIGDNCVSGFIYDWNSNFFIIDKKVPINADRILDHVKNQFKEDGPIEGSWIEMTKVPWKKYAYDTDVYYGGVSRFEEGRIVQYEFIADAYTGTIMDIYKI